MLLADKKTPVICGNRIVGDGEPGWRMLGVADLREGGENRMSFDCV
jgi:hypothetical protein